jgi:hypothetical protein
LPLGNPRRIFVRQPRRTGVRITGMVLTACVATVLAAHPVFSALGQIMQGGGTPSALAADNVAVMDGQTLRVAGHVVRLDGVAAPARGAGCAAGADCAGRAALHLAALVQDQRVACQVIGADPAACAARLAAGKSTRRWWPVAGPRHAATRRPCVRPRTAPAPSISASGPNANNAGGPEEWHIPPSLVFPN